MPIPADLSWWMWGAQAGVCLLFSVLFLVVSQWAKEKNEGVGCLMSMGGVALGLWGLVCTIFAVIRFVKWIWAG